MRGERGYSADRSQGSSSGVPEHYERQRKPRAEQNRTEDDAVAAQEELGHEAVLDGGQQVDEVRAGSPPC